MFKLKIETKNAAFQENPEYEIIRILQLLSTKLYDGHTDGVIHDINGNKVCEWTLTKR